MLHTSQRPNTKRTKQQEPSNIAPTRLQAAERNTPASNRLKLTEAIYVPVHLSPNIHLGAPFSPNYGPLKFVI